MLYPLMSNGGALSETKTVGGLSLLFFAVDETRQDPKCDLGYDVASRNPRRGNWFWRTIVRDVSTDPRGVKLT